jgi:sensor domain CHASE-containing protein
MDIQAKLTNYQERQAQLQEFIKQSQEQIQKAQLECVMLSGAIAALNDLVNESTKEPELAQEVID